MNYKVSRCHRSKTVLFRILYFPRGVGVYLYLKFVNIGSFGHFAPMLNSYTGWPNKNGTVDTVNFQDFALINSYNFSPCWIEHLFLIIITPRSSNLAENFLFYE